MIRGLVSGMKTRDGTERKALAAAGLKPIYGDLAECLGSLRKGDLVGVTDLRALGRKRTDIERSLKILHRRGHAAITIPERRRSDGPDGAILLSEALGMLANDGRGKRKRKKRSEHQMPLDQIKVFWFNPLLSVKQVMAAVNGDKRYPVKIGYTTIWRHLGMRKSTAGRPSKKE